MRRILDAVQEIIALRTREERRARLDRVPEEIRAFVAQEVKYHFEIARGLCAKLDNGYPWDKLPEGSKELLYTMGFYERPRFTRKGNDHSN